MTTDQLLPLLHLDDFVAIDFETTGLDPGTCQIIEAAAVRFRMGEPVGEFQQLVNPGEAIPREVVDLTNITDDMVADQPPIEQVGQELLDFIGDSPLVTQNISFDLAFLHNICRTLGRSDTISNLLYDTLPLGRTFLYHHSSFSLSALCEFYGIPHQHAHRAYHDALNTGHLFIKLVEEAASYPLPMIQALLSVQDHVTIPNKSLYMRIVQTMSATGQVKGLTSSTVERPVTRAIFDHDGACANYVPVTPGDYFGENGRLASRWDRFEFRPAQVEFAEAVGTTFEEGNILIAEAGTGLGKSMGYLLAAVNHACRHGSPVVISCHTKHLQDQLFTQEIPRLVTALDAPVRAVMLKGRGNYLCRTRLEFVLANANRLLGPDDCEKILPIIIWGQFTQTGDIDECPGFLSRWSVRLWRMLNSERGFCLGNTCSRYNGCFLGPIRRAAKQASLIVVNHALLMADAADDAGLLPNDYRLVLDEAHNLQRVATNQLTMEFGEEIVRNLTGNYLRSRYRQIFRNKLRDALQIIEQDGDLYGRLQQAAGALQQATADLLEAYVLKYQFKVEAEWKYSTHLGRYIDPHTEFRGLETNTSAAAAALATFNQTLVLVHKLLTQSDVVPGETLVNELETDLSQAMALEAAYRRIALEEPARDDVLWREVRAAGAGVKVVFKCAPLTVADFLQTRLFERRPGTVLCSATLQVGTSFDYFRSEVGLDAGFDACPTEEHEFPSPFLYDEQCVVLSWEAPVDVVDPKYPQELAELIDSLTDQVQRRLLVLFTSYAQLRAVHEVLYSRLFRTDRRLLTQFSRTSRRALLAAFKENPRGILLGTASFWEGVDLPGDLLEMIIIARLPFANPTEPVVAARIEYLQEQGRNPFMDYQIPDAITRFRQGFGRLIRTTYDEGIFIVADSRVTRRRYGQLFLDALPVEAIPFRYVDRIASLVGQVIFQGDRS